jgi:hypothetical protein
MPGAPAFMVSVKRHLQSPYLFLMFSDTTEAFITLCEELWQGWMDSKRVTPKLPKVAQVFDREAAPEPYLYFGAGTKALIALTTNPGQPMGR